VLSSSKFIPPVNRERWEPSDKRESCTYLPTIVPVSPQAILFWQSCLTRSVSPGGMSPSIRNIGIVSLRQKAKRFEPMANLFHPADLLEALPRSRLPVLVSKAVCSPLIHKAPTKWGQSFRAQANSILPSRCPVSKKTAGTLVVVALLSVGNSSCHECQRYFQNGCQKQASCRVCKLNFPKMNQGMGLRLIAIAQRRSVPRKSHILQLGISQFAEGAARRYRFPSRYPSCHHTQ